MWSFFQRLWNGGKVEQGFPEFGEAGLSLIRFDVGSHSAFDLTPTANFTGISSSPIYAQSEITSKQGYLSDMTTGDGYLSKINLYEASSLSHIELDRSAVSQIDVSGQSAISGIFVQPINKFSIIDINNGSSSQITTGCGAISTIRINIGAMSIFS